MALIFFLHACIEFIELWWVFVIVVFYRILITAVFEGFPRYFRQVMGHSAHSAICLLMGKNVVAEENFTMEIF